MCQLYKADRAFNNNLCSSPLEFNGWLSQSILYSPLVYLVANTKLELVLGLWLAMIFEWFEVEMWMVLEVLGKHSHPDLVLVEYMPATKWSIENMHFKSCTSIPENNKLFQLISIRLMVSAFYIPQVLLVEGKSLESVFLLLVVAIRILWQALDIHILAASNFAEECISAMLKFE